jgi:hypothetical protein
MTYSEAIRIRDRVREELEMDLVLGKSELTASEVHARVRLLDEDCELLFNISIDIDIFAAHL